jgi:hypothetical protein
MPSQPPSAWPSVTSRLAGPMRRDDVDPWRIGDPWRIVDDSHPRP